jgi:hypothetical protein
MWVRVEIGGVSETAWIDLAALRLPEVVSSGPRTAWSGTATGVARSTMRPAGIPGGGVAGPYGQESASDAADDPAPTQHLPLVRDAVEPRLGNAHRGSGGRRRAPELAESGRHEQSGPVNPAALAGRHRAPATRGIPTEPGRHRAADTGVVPAIRPVVADWAASAAAGDWAPPPPRSELPPAGPVVRPRTVSDPDGDLLTRPMRLDEAVGSARAARRRDSLRV